MTPRTRNALHGAAVLVIIGLAAAAVRQGPDAVTVLGGLLLTLVLPGYGMTRLLGRHRVLAWYEQLFCVPVLSFATAVLGGLLANATGFSLTKPTWTAMLAGVAAAGILADAILPPRRQEPDEQAARWRWSRPEVWSAAGLALVVALLAGTAYLGLRSAEETTPPAATSLSMVQAYSSEAPGDTRTVAIGVWNGESTRTKFTIRITGIAGYSKTLTADVFAQSQWSATTRVPATGKVIAELFRPGDNNPYRMVFEDEPL